MGTDNEVWIDDRYGVREFAKILGAQVRETYENSAEAAPGTRAARDQSLTIAINAPWGKGKSFFLDRFAKEMSGTHPVIVFDAWKTDFSGSPLAAFCFEIGNQISSSQGFDEKAIADFKKATSTLVMHHLINIGSSLVSAGVSAVIPGAGLAVDAIKKGIEASGESLPAESEDSFNKLLDEYMATKSAIKDMRVALGELVESVANSGKKKLPIIIVVDELDRCRPIYAIELLECVKHIFEVKGVYFVFGTNLDSLADSVRAVYGNDFNGRGYLERFFSLEVGLPDRSSISYVKEVLKDAYPGKTFLPGLLKHATKNKSEFEDLASLLSNISEYYELTPRDLNSIGTKLAIILKTHDEFHAVPLFCLLCFWQRNKGSAVRLFSNFNWGGAGGILFTSNRESRMPRIEYDYRSSVDLRSLFETYYLVMDHAIKGDDSSLRYESNPLYVSVRHMIYANRIGRSEKLLWAIEEIQGYPVQIVSAKQSEFGRADLSE